MGLTGSSRQAELTGWSTLSKPLKTWHSKTKIFASRSSVRHTPPIFLQPLQLLTASTVWNGKKCRGSNLRQDSLYGGLLVRAFWVRLGQLAHVEDNPVKQIRKGFSNRRWAAVVSSSRLRSKLWMTVNTFKVCSVDENDGDEINSHCVLRQQRKCAGHIHIAQSIHCCCWANVSVWVKLCARKRACACWVAWW